MKCQHCGNEMDLTKSLVCDVCFPRPKTGIQLIAAERERQITTEGWSPEHDATHTKGELADAGLCYIYASFNVGHPAAQKSPPEWPWAEDWWKPSDDPIRNLVKAGALIAAEIDRLAMNERNELERLSAGSVHSVSPSAFGSVDADPAIENERCKLALQNLSACGYGQTLTHAVDGISELVKAFRESDTKLREEKERLQNALREMVRRTYSETELRRIAREALDSCENSNSTRETAE